MSWTKQTPYQGAVHHGCRNCGDTQTIAPLDMVIAVGFGAAYATKDDQTIYDEMEVMHAGGEWDDFWPLSKVEELAKADPDHDWRVVMHGPLRGRTYQRHGDGEWVLIESNEGFA